MPSIWAAIQDLDPEGQVILVALPVLQRYLCAWPDRLRRIAVRKAGVVCGIGAAFGVTRLLAAFLFEVKQWDPLVFFVVPAILLGVAAVSVWWPAMRASRVDPIRGLRCE